MNAFCDHEKFPIAPLGRTHTQPVRSLVKRAKTKEDRTKQTSGCSHSSCKSQRHIMKEVMASVDPFWPAERVYAPQFFYQHQWKMYWSAWLILLAKMV